MADYKVNVRSKEEWQRQVEDKDLTTSPAASKGDRYIIAGIGGNWSGGTINDVAVYNGASWVFYTPVEGWICWVKDENELYLFNGSSWNAYPIIDDFTIKKANTELKVADRIELNIMLNAFRIAINGSLSQFNMVDGISDEFEDESGVDTVNSINEGYDSVNDLYEPTGAALLELDYMEYASDGAAQTAYVSSDGTPVESIAESYLTGGDPLPLNGIGSGNWYQKLAQEFQSASAIKCSKVSLGIKTIGSPTDNVTVRIETDSSGLPSGTLVDANATKSVPAASITSSITWIDFVFPATFDLSAATIYHIVIGRTDSYDNVDYYRVDKWEPGTYANGIARTFDTGDAWNDRTASDFKFRLYKKATNLQCYSEASIKNQGSYSLKVVAVQTDSLNDTLTKSGLSIDLSDRDTLKLWVYASRTGTNIQIQIHDSGGTTSTKDIVISSANTWTEITWDISGISNANKDDIDSIIIKIINADADNTFYVDNFYTPLVISDMTLISDSFVAEAQPDTARIVLFEEDVDSITENTDIKAYVSRDGGSTYAQVTLSDEGDYESGKRILTGIVDLTQSGVGSGTNIEYKITTLNTKNLKLHGVGLHWD